MVSMDQAWRSAREIGPVQMCSVGLKVRAAILFRGEWNEGRECHDAATALMSAVTTVENPPKRIA